MHIIAPMLAKASELPKEETAYGFEIKWDGLRAIVYIDSSNVTILSRNSKDITSQYPEVAGVGQALEVGSYILDGEIIAFGQDSKPSFSQLQHRMGLSSAKRIRAMMQQIPVTYIIFDILFSHGESLIHLPYSERRSRLEALELASPYWQTPAYSRDGNGLLAISLRLGLEGIMAKNLGSPYTPGKRTGAWLKIKNQQRQEFIIGGWLAGAGSRQGLIGSLLVGYYDANSQLRYAGAVGTGFTVKTLKTLALLLAPLSQPNNPFVDQPPQKEIHFVQPKLIGEFEFTEWTPNSTLRHPSFKGLRNDKNPLEIVREDQKKVY